MRDWRERHFKLKFWWNHRFSKSWWRSLYTSLKGASRFLLKWCSVSWVELASLATMVNKSQTLQELFKCFGN